MIITIIIIIIIIIMAWDVTVSHTYTDTHDNTAIEAGTAASHADTNKTSKYCQLSITHVFTPVAVETAGTWHHQAIELVQELERRAVIIVGDSTKTI